jgi:hypothetical protein
MRLFLISKTMAIPIIMATVILNAIHPFIHGTPLDGGGLDAALQQLNLMTLYMLDRGD